MGVEYFSGKTAWMVKQDFFDRSNEDSGIYPNPDLLYSRLGTSLFLFANRKQVGEQMAGMNRGLLY